MRHTSVRIAQVLGLISLWVRKTPWSQMVPETTKGQVNSNKKLEWAEMLPHSPWEGYAGHIDKSERAKPCKHVRTRTVPWARALQQKPIEETAPSWLRVGSNEDLTRGSPTHAVRVVVRGTGEWLSCQQHRTVLTVLQKRRGLTDNVNGGIQRLTPTLVFALPRPWQKQVPNNTQASRIRYANHVCCFCHW